MCGICGIYSNKKEIRANFKLKKMLSLLEHRGPNGEGSWSDKKINLGHRRLSIVDLSKSGNQPFFNETKDIVLVCNGEIYNADILRRDLLKKGHKFLSKSDNEVIIHLYEELGIGLVNKLIGMFAFAIWDKKKEILFLARDRIGEKPLYYRHSKSNFYFSSEIKPIIAVDDRSTNIADNTFANFLGLDSIPAPYTAFANIFLLPPASILKFELNTISIFKYWKIDYLNIEKKWSHKDALDVFQSKIASAVKYTSVSDVDVGLLLSGGVDSSIIASIHSDKNNNNQQSFCISQKSITSQNIEFKRASNVAEYFGYYHENHVFDINEIAKLPQIINAYEQPISSFPSLFTFKFMESISKKLKVVLSGNGADEVFLGYSGYENCVLKSTIMGIVSDNKICNLAVKSLVNKNSIISKLVDSPFQNWKSILFQESTFAVANKLIYKDKLKMFQEQLPYEIFIKEAHDCNPRDYLDVLSYTDLMITHQHGTHLIPDISGMSHGVEIRSPFLNHELIEFAASLPRNLLIPSLFNSKNNKLLLKKYLEQFLPKEIVYAKKVGFGYDINYLQLMFGPWKKIIQKYVFNGNYLDIVPINKELITSNQFNDSRIIWKLLSFSIWHDIFMLGKDHNIITEDFKYLLR